MERDTYDSPDIRASAMAEIACEICPLCGRGAGVARINGTYTHFPEACKAANVWAEIAELVLGRLN